MNLPDYIYESVEYIRQQNIPEPIDAAIILGSGLGGFGQQITDPVYIPYSSIPHFPKTSVKGHEGKLIAGTINRKYVLAFSGRFHHYEGHTFEITALPIYIAKALAVGKLLISNAAGAINTDYEIGDLVLIDSVLRQNFSISPSGYKKNRYKHASTARKAKEVAEKAGINIQNGTFIYSKGPNYETKAEICAYHKMGADTVGMSTAPELFEASRLGIKTAAVSLVTNMAAGIADKKLNHAEVKAAAEEKKSDFANLVELLIEKL